MFDALMLKYIQNLKMIVWRGRLTWTCYLI